ncbi:hypothetical protein ACIHDR_46770 [Nocardia sp. NPDC052278]|uniref:hypothetical protein n=1 Tax=unclassified Nocardia TaxID=2637762 RepID=UPI00369D3953
MITTTPTRVGSNYLCDVFTPGLVIEDAREHLIDRGVQFDTLIGTGLSGALIIPLLAHTFDVSYLIVRKTSHDSHSDSPAEGYLGQQWLFVDDFLNTGQTLRKVHETTTDLAKANGLATRFVGGYFYERSQRSQPFIPAFALQHRCDMAASGRECSPLRRHRNARVAVTGRPSLCLVS